MIGETNEDWMEIYDPIQIEKILNECIHMLDTNMFKSCLQKGDLLYQMLKSVLVVCEITIFLEKQE